MFSQCGIWPKLQNVNLEREAWKRAGFWTDSGEVPCPNPAGAMPLSGLFRAKSVSMFLGIKVLFWFPAEAGASCDAQVLFLALNLDFHFFGFSPFIHNMYMWAVTDHKEIPWTVIANSSEVQSVEWDPFKASRKKAEYYKACKNCTPLFKPSCRDVNSFRHCYSLFSQSVQFQLYSEFWSSLFALLYD